MPIISVYKRQVNNVPEEELSDYESIEKRILNKALDTLSDRRKSILLDYYRHENINSEKGNWTPPEALNEMCEYYDSTKYALRKTKERALKKLKEYIEQTERQKIIK